LFCISVDFSVYRRDGVETRRLAESNASGMRWITSFAELHLDLVLVCAGAVPVLL